jgi:hypothetical protein
MFKVGDRVAVIHLHRVGKDRRRGLEPVAQCLPFLI